MTTSTPAITRRSALGLVTAAAAACVLPALPGRAAEPDPASAGPLEVVSYEAVAERGCGVTRISTPWYSLTLEDGLFPQGAYWEYDEAGLGFDAQGATEACSVLRVYDRGSGELACAAYLASDHERREPPFGGDWAVAQSERVEGLSLYLACPVDHPADDSARDRSLERAVGLRNRLSANDRYTHLVRDPEAGTTAVETTRYRVTIPDDAFPQGWRYTFNDSLVDHMGSGYHVYEWLHIYPADSYSEACAFFATTGFCMQG
ncbi:MAG: hypothetical protein E7211_19025, partial [Clostridium lundense]|nr:hypothetical protein [Clostridium lundense]